MHPAAAQDRGAGDRTNRTARATPEVQAAQDQPALTINQIAAEWDAHTARIKADLRLTDEQEKNWPKFEGVLHDIGQRRAQRQVMARAERGKPKDPEDFITSLNRVGDALGERSSDLKKLAEAAAPLYASLDERQKKYLTRAMGPTSHESDDQKQQQ